MSEKLTHSEIDRLERAVDSKSLSPRASGDIDRIIDKLRQLVKTNV